MYRSKTKTNPINISGSMLAVIAGIVLYFWYSRGSAPTAMMLSDSPTDAVVGAIGGLAAYLSLPAIPGLIKKIMQIIGITNQIKSLIPQELIDQISAGIKAGHIDVQAILAAYEGLDTQELMRLIQSLLALIGKPAVVKGMGPNTTMAFGGTIDGVLPADYVVIQF